ncbi:MAG: electron transporter, partial [Candidatus Magasanikbacteria bacterium CG_4_9_14_0_2_um_filter_42_11]
MFKLIKLLILIAILGVGWWLLSPLFIDKKV